MASLAAADDSTSLGTTFVCMWAQQRYCSDLNRPRTVPTKF
jgi:hypothetical protein